MNHVEKLPNGCWKWTAATTRNGYGIFRDNGKNYPAHRWLYEYSVGAIPSNLECDHLCRNRCCVNPDHIEPVTKLENNRRGNGGKWQKEKTHCPNGHPYVEENTIYRTFTHRNGQTYTIRVCKQCLTDKRNRKENKEYMKRYSHEWYIKNKSAIIRKTSEWRNNNKDKVAGYNKKWYTKRHATSEQPDKE